MFTYTKVAVDKIKQDFKRFIFIWNILTQVAYILYLIYALVKYAILENTSSLVVNIVLLIVALLYFVVFIIALVDSRNQGKKRVKKVAKKIFTRTKQLIKLFNIGVMLYGGYYTANQVTVLSVILSAFMIVGFVLQVIFEVIYHFVVKQLDFIATAVKTDFEEMKKPVKEVGNFFKKIAGQTVEEQREEKSKNRLWLDENVEKFKAERKAEKLRKKQMQKRKQKDDANE